MGLLNRDQILAASDLTYEEVKVPEWAVNGTDMVRVRGMTGAERDRWEVALLESSTDDKKWNRRQVRATLIALTVVDADGKRLFTEEDIEALGAKSVRALQRIYNVAQRLSRISASDIEALAKN